MSVEFHSSYSTSTASAGKSVDLQTLQESFAAALRSYTTASSSQTDTMLEVLQTAQENNADARKQERHDYQQQNDPGVAEQRDQKLLNKSDLRYDDLNADYQNQRDRQERLQIDYHEKIEQRANLTNSENANSLVSSNQQSQNQRTESRSLLDQGIQNSVNILPPQHNVVSQNSAPSVPVSSSNVLQNSSSPETAVAAMPINPAGGQTSPTPVSSPQVLPVNAFTIFTASKRFGQNQEEQEEKDEKEQTETAVDDVPIKKPQPFAVFEAIKIADSRRQSATQREPATVSPNSRQMLAEREPKEIEPNRLAHVKTIDEFLNTSPNGIVPKNGEQNPPEQTQYFHRIAAACEAAAMYAPIRIKVHLGNLGTMTLRFFYQSEKLMLQFETPSEDSAEFLQEHLEGLKTILSKRNVKLESVEVLLAIN